MTSWTGKRIDPLSELTTHIIKIKKLFLPSQTSSRVNIPHIILSLNYQNQNAYHDLTGSLLQFFK